MKMVINWKVQHTKAMVHVDCMCMITRLSVKLLSVSVVEITDCAKSFANVTCGSEPGISHLCLPCQNGGREMYAPNNAP